MKLCTRGMQAEAAGDVDAASDCYRQARDSAADDYERCVAAHYVARHQPSEEDRLAWNQRALDLAHAVADPRVASFYPSLLLNLGRSLEVTGDRDRARELYLSAEEHASVLPEGPYGDLVRRGLAAALARTRADEAPSA